MKAISMIALTVALLAAGHGSVLGAQTNGVIVKPRQIEVPRTSTDKPDEPKRDEADKNDADAPTTRPTHGGEDKPSQQNDEDDKDEPKPAAEDPPSGGDEPASEEPDYSSEQLEGFRDQDYDPIACTIDSNFTDWLTLSNIDDVATPNAVLVKIHLPDGSIKEVVLPSMAPGGDWGVQIPGGFPEGWTCEIEVILT